MTALQTSVQTASAVRPEGASGIRAFTASDVGEVADLLARAFQGSERPAPAGMAAYLREAYLDAPWFDPEIASRVLVHGGRIAGFVGVSAMPMLLDGHAIRTAVISSLSADPRLADPMIGPRLLRHVRSGPQDAVLNDRSNPVAVSLLRSLKFEVIREYSLTWVRALRPAGLAIETLARRFGPLRRLAPLVAPLDDAAVERGLRSESPRWSVPTGSRAAERFTDQDANLADLRELVPHFLSDFPLRPAWSKADLAIILRDAARKCDLGDFVSRVVIARSGEPAGLFLYHMRRGRTAHVLQIMAARGSEGAVLDRALAHAARSGAVAIRGRAQPALVDALMARRVILVPDLATVVYSRHPGVLEHFRNGSAFFTGLAGENWMRLNGDQF